MLGGADISHELMKRLDENIYDRILHIQLAMHICITQWSICASKTSTKGRLLTKQHVQFKCMAKTNMMEDWVTRRWPPTIYVRVLEAQTYLNFPSKCTKQVSEVSEGEPSQTNKSPVL
jgi:hypothetical protein